MTHAKSLKRRWDLATAPPELAESGVPQHQWPTRPQYALWWKFVRIPIVVEEGWWMGSCPAHDPTGERPEATAEFMFQYGAYRCFADDGEPCHPGKSAGTLDSIRHLITDDDIKFIATEPEPEPDWDVPLPPDEQAALDAKIEKWEALKNKSWRRHGNRGA